MSKLTELMPGTPKERTKLFIVLGIFVVVFIFLLFQLPSCKPTARKPDSTAWRLVTELNTKLAEDPAFTDAGFAIATESPLRLKVVGAVHTQADLDKLTEALKTIRPQGDYDVEVELIQH